MTDQPGFTIGNDFYPFPSSFRLGDPVLVAEVTGASWNEFAEMLDDNDPRSLAGLVAVAVWQKHPTWRREKVLRYVEAMDMDALEFEGETGPDVIPPADAGSSALTEIKPATSTSSSDSTTPSGPTPGSTGTPPSEDIAA